MAGSTRHSGRAWPARADPRTPARPASSGRSTRCSGAGTPSPGSTLPEVALAALEAWRESPVVFPGMDLPERDSSLLSGEAGVLLVAWSLTERPDLADDLYARVRANVHADELDELMWGTRGDAPDRPRAPRAHRRGALARGMS